MSTFETGNELAILTASRNILWTDQAAYTPLLAGVTTIGAPATAAAGVELSNAVKALVSVELRSEVHHRQSSTTIPIHDGATTYILTIDGTAISHSVGGDTRADQAIRGLVTGINASVPLDGVVTAYALNAAGEDVTAIAYDATSNDTVTATAAVTCKVSGDTESNWTIAESVSGGTGTIATVADPANCSIRVYSTRKLASGSSGWTKVPGSEVSLDYRGFTDRFTVNGLKRLFVEVFNPTAVGDGTSITYAPTVRIGPAVLE